MKALAEFAMRSRVHALGLALAGVVTVIFCWVAAATLALVTLRKGAADGAWVLLWAVLPAGALALYVADAGPLLLLLGTTALALVLRSTVSLSLSVLASVAVGLLSGLAMWLFAGPLLDEIVRVFGEVLGSMERQLTTEGGAALTLARPTALQVAGMLGAGNAVMSVACLLLGRYWQAELYNPGGFGLEFRALAMPAALATGLLAAAVLVWTLGVQYRTWAIMFLVPLSYTGLALVHARARQRSHGHGWLVGFYLLWVVFDVVRLALVLVAVADSYWHFRQRWASSAGDGQGGAG